MKSVGTFLVSVAVPLLLERATAVPTAGDWAGVKKEMSSAAMFGGDIVGFGGLLDRIEDRNGRRRLFEGFGISSLDVEEERIEVEAVSEVSTRLLRRNVEM